MAFVLSHLLYLGHNEDMSPCGSPHIQKIAHILPAGGARRGGREQLCKKYGQGFVWGQLNGWFKQTVRASVSDPVHDPPLDSADLLHLRSLVLMLIHSWKLPLNTLKSM